MTALIKMLVEILRKCRILKGGNSAELCCGVGCAKHGHSRTVEFIDNVVICHDVAYTEAAESQHLGDGKYTDRPFPHTGQCRSGYHLHAVEHRFLKCLIDNQHQIVTDDELRKLLHVTAPIADGGGIVGVRKNNHFRLRRQSGFKGFNVELIAIFLINRNTDNLAAEDLGVLEVIRITGVNDHDLVAIVDKRQHRIEKCGVRTGGNKDVALRDDIQAIEPLEFFCQLTIELRIANWHGIMAC